MFPGKGLYIYYLCKLYHEGNLNLLRTLVDTLCMGHQSILVNNYKILHHYVLCRLRLLHKVMDYTGLFLQLVV